MSRMPLGAHARNAPSTKSRSTTTSGSAGSDLSLGVAAVELYDVAVNVGLTNAQVGQVVVPLP